MLGSWDGRECGEKGGTFKRERRDAKRGAVWAREIGEMDVGWDERVGFGGGEFTVQANCVMGFTQEQ